MDGFFKLKVRRESYFSGFPIDRFVSQYLKSDTSVLFNCILVNLEVLDESGAHSDPKSSESYLFFAVATVWRSASAVGLWELVLTRLSL